ncbi:MAG TPA: hypothetical protein DCS63_07270 [Elusimicrobia bacterium]|nr:hypothetical protein [Elusimicrobiota bacterium]
MKKFIISALLALPAWAFAQEAPGYDPDLPPALSEAKDEDMGLNGTEQAGEPNAAPVQRPDAAGIMAEIATPLRLSSKQEERITAAVDRKAEEFDELMADYLKSAAQEKKWRYKMNDSRHAMQKINSGIPDTVREFLDDDQRQNYDGLEAAKRKPAPRPEAPAVEPARPLDWDGSVKPLKKKRVLRRKKIRASAPAAPATVSGAAEEEAGQVMVDRDPAAARPAPRKRRVLKKKARVAEPPVEDIMVDEPAGAQSTGREAPAEEDAGSYP